MKRVWESTEREKKVLDLYIKLRRSVNSVEKRIASKNPLPERLTMSQFAVLEALFFHGPLPQHVIAEKILSSTGNLTFVVDNLVKAGLVKRVADERDRRIKNIQLTQEGSELIAKAFPNVADAIVTSISVLTDQEIDELSRILKILGTEQRN